MRVLVTAGGTRVPWDEIRWLGNASTGRLGAALVEALLRRGHHVVHLHGVDALRPHIMPVDLREPIEVIEAKLRARHAELAAQLERYRNVAFTTFDDYAERLERLIRDEQPDLVVLAAAVSDFAPEAASGKLDSREVPTVRMRRLPKLIEGVKQWRPEVVLAGFKLLVGVTEEELFRVAEAACRRTGADVTIANDLRTQQAGRHTLHLVRPGHAVRTLAPDDGDVPTRLAAELETLVAERADGEGRG